MLEKTNRLPFLFLARNTFVLEYCGEVLDHKEFKARVKEYARNKNIHYYFMALKNDEVSGMNMFVLKQIWKLLSLKGIIDMDYNINIILPLKYKWQK